MRSVLKDAGRKVPELVESDILGKLALRPQREKLSDDSTLVRGIMESVGYPEPWDDIPGLLAACGGTKSLQFFQTQFRAGRQDVLLLLAQLGDSDTVGNAIEEVRTGTEPGMVEAVIRAVETLPEPHRFIAVRRCIANWAIPVSSIFGAVDDLSSANCREAISKCLERGDAPVTLLLDHAVRVELRDERLVALAQSDFTRSGNCKQRKYVGSERRGRENQARRENDHASSSPSSHRMLLASMFREPDSGPSWFPKGEPQLVLPHCEQRRKTLHSVIRY